MVKTTHIWCENFGNNIFKNLTPLFSFQGGQKGLKFEKNTFFEQNQFLERERWVVPLFLLQILKEECLGLTFRKKNHGVDRVEKSLRSFKKKF